MTRRDLESGRVRVDPVTGEIFDGPVLTGDQVNSIVDQWDLLPPDEEEFESSESGFLLSEPLATLGAELIQRHQKRFWYLAKANSTLSIAYCWKRSGGASAGKRVFGKCQKTSGALRLFSDVDWVIWLAADHVRDAGWGADEIERLLYHELQHTGFDAKKGAVIRGHDFNGFNEEIAQYGLWHRDLEHAGRTMRDSGAIDQLPEHEQIMRNQVVRG